MALGSRLEEMRRALRERLVGGIVSAASAPVRRRSFGRSRGTPEALEVRSADGTALHADVFAPGPGGEAGERGTMVLAHGYRDGRGQLGFLVGPLVRRGWRVMAFDFRAHGRSGGERITVGGGEADDVRAMIEAARATRPGEPVAFFGYSMGASAYLLSGVEADVAVLDSPYDTLEAAIAARFTRLGMSGARGRAFASEAAARMGIALDRARPIDAVAGLTRPTLFVFARLDPWIGEATRRAFAEKLPARGSIRVVPGGHRLHFGAGWRETVVGFFQSWQSA